MLGNANDYSQCVSSQQNISVEFEQAIVDMIRYAIAIAIACSLGLNTVDDASTLCGALAFAIKTYTVENAPSVTNCIYNQPTQLNQMYRTDLSYYVAGAYVISKTYYENYFYN